jgi:flavodoxin/Pyruvate/2-oxoacid:ferredoxin oxidoreductase delta subunit
VKCIVIYFSQTGNTEKVAKAIQSGVKQAAGNCDIATIKDANPRRLYEYDLIGLGSPVFEVVNVWDFIKNMRFVGGKHVFAFCTHGGSPGPFLSRIYQKLKDRGPIVIGTRDWYGDCYLLHHIEPYPTKGHPDEIDLQEAEEFGREMVVRSWKIAAGRTELIPPEPAVPPMPQMQPVPDFRATEPWKLISSFPSRLKFHKEKCLYPGCRLCMDNCPMDGIDLSLDPPVIARPCEFCEFCARICPTGALDMNEWVEALIKVGVDMPVPTGEQNPLLSDLAKAEAEGRFRRLLPVEELKPDTYGSMLHKKHPQWIIGKGAQ